MWWKNYFIYNHLYPDINLYGILPQQKFFLRTEFIVPTSSWLTWFLSSLNFIQKMMEDKIILICGSLSQHLGLSKTRRSAFKSAQIIPVSSLIYIYKHSCNNASPRGVSLVRDIYRFTFALLEAATKTALLRSRQVLPCGIWAGIDQDRLGGPAGNPTPPRRILSSQRVWLQRDRARKLRTVNNRWSLLWRPSLQSSPLSVTLHINNDDPDLVAAGYVQ